MKQIFQHFSGRVTAIALGGALALAGSTLAFTQKPKGEHFTPPPVDETPIVRDVGGHTSFAPVVKKVAPGVVKVFTTSKAHNTSFNPNGGSGFNGPEGGPDMDDMFRRFFGDQFQGRTPRRNFNMPRQQG